MQGEGREGVSVHYFLMQEHWSLFSHGGTQKLAEEFGIPFLGSIPLDPVRKV